MLRTILFGIALLVLAGALGTLARLVYANVTVVKGDIAAIVARIDLMSSAVSENFSSVVRIECVQTQQHKQISDRITQVQLSDRDKADELMMTQKLAAMDEKTGRLNDRIVMLEVHSEKPKEPQRREDPVTGAGSFAAQRAMAERYALAEGGL